MPPADTPLLPADPAGIAAAVRLLRAGGLVGFPTETVYGLGADARNPGAVAAIYAAKGRPTDNPLIVHLADAAAARALAAFDPLADRLADAFWPGPLTLVLPLGPDAGLAPAVTAGRPTVALRVPSHPAALRLLGAFGGPLAGPSANPSGKLSPTRAADVLAGLGGRIAAVLDGRDCAIGLESTIVATADGRLRLLRPGALAADPLARAAGVPVEDATRLAGTAPEAPGQMAAHYAPEAALRLDVAAPRPGEVWIGFGPGMADADLTLSAAGDLAEAAATLFATLRAADRLAAARGGAIAVAPVPGRGLGAAINDRLRRAAASGDRRRG
jgi:L-threonylcarbamoyladenylate synthase